MNLSSGRLGAMAGVVRWFSPIAVWVAALGIGVVVASRRRGNRGRILLAVGTLTGVAVAAATIGDQASKIGYQIRFHHRIGPAAVGAASAWTEGHAQAARWLKVASLPFDVVATNRLCTDAKERPPSCSDAWFLVSALTGRRMLIEGYTYGVGVGELPKWAIDRVDLSMRFSDHPTEQDARDLWARGVRWVWVDHAVTSNLSWEPFATVVFSNEVASVLRLHELPESH